MKGSIAPRLNNPQKTRILWVDDDKSILELGKALLNLMGYESRTATNGREALNLLEKEFCPIVITDLQMPIMNGYDLIQAIRKNYGQKCFIIAVSGSQEYLEIINAFSLANIAMIKPIALDVLRLILEENQ